MNPLREWAQHQLLRALTAPKNKDINKKLIADIRKKWFVSPRYKRVFSLIKKEYEASGKFPSWKALMANPSLSSEDSKYLRAKEIKRRSNEKDDLSLRIPIQEEDYDGILSRMRFDAKHIAVINLHNKVSQALDNDNMLPEELDAIMSTLSGETARIAETDTPKAEHISLTHDSARKILKTAYKNLQNRFFIPTGFKAFDSINIGIPASSLFVVLGKSGAGKSTLALNICVNAKRAGARACFVPLEMSVDEMLLKMGSLLLKEKLTDLTQNMRRSFKKIRRALDEFLQNEMEEDESCFDFYIPEAGDTVEEVLNYLQPYGYDIICIDYPKLLSSGSMEEWKALDKGAAFAKRFSARNRTYVLWLAQINDVTEDIRYSKAVLEHASNAWVITGDIEENREAGRVLIKQRKARSQSPHSFNLACDLSCSYFGDLEEEGIGDHNERKRRRRSDDDVVEEAEIKDTRSNQDKSRVSRDKGRVKMKVAPGLDYIDSSSDVFLDVPEE